MIATAFNIRLTDLTPSTTNPRKRFDAHKLDELAASVAKHGVLQPILVRRVNGGYEIVAGERRYRAAKAAGLTEIPVIVRDLSDVEAIEIQVIENLQRDDLHPLEEADGYRQLLVTKKYDVARIAEKVGRSVKYVYDRVKLLELVPEAQTLFADGAFTPGHAILLARLSPTDQKRALTRGTGIGRAAGLFEHEDSLFDRYDERGRRQGGEMSWKPVSVKEFERWIAENVKFDRSKVDPMLFPETAAAVDEASGEKRKIIPIVKTYLAPADIRGYGSAAKRERIYGEQAWKRADGNQGSKTCDRSVLGVIVGGPGYGEAFPVCIAKEKCKTHWAAWQRDRARSKKGASTGGAAGARRDQRERDRWEQQRQEQERRRLQWKRATPELRKAFDAALAGASVSRLLDVACQNERIKRTAVKNPEDFLRAVVVSVIEAALGWHAEHDVPNPAKALGIDYKSILAKHAEKGKAGAGAEAAATRGVCRKCGCTYDEPCPEGCAWTDETETLCTACAPASAEKARTRAPKKKGTRKAKSKRKARAKK